MVMRIGGLASGMDIDQLVRDMMKAERARGDKLFRTTELSKWRQTAYNDVNKSLANFILDTKKNFGLLSVSSNGSMSNQSIDKLSWVKKSTVSDSKLADITVNSSVPTGEYLVKVKELAKNFTTASNSEISKKTDGKIDLTNLATQFEGLAVDDEINFTITGYKKNSAKEDSITISGKAGELNIRDIVNKINKADIGVVANYDAGTDRFFLQTKDTGEASNFTIKDESTKANGDSLNFMTGLKKGPDGTYEPGNILGLNIKKNINDQKSHGQDAVLDFAGAKDIKQSKNTFTINGINFSLKEIGEFKINVTTDVDGIYNKVAEFVTKYNEMIDTVNGKLTEKTYRDYQPLTKDEKEAMKEKEIETWETYAKSGLLKGDGLLTSTLSTVRGDLYKSVAGVGGDYDHLTKIGITTQEYKSGAAGGKLQIDEVALKKAIEENPDEILNLLFKETTDYDLLYKDESTLTKEQLEKKRSESGLITRIYDNLAAGIKEVIHKAGTGENAELYRQVKSNILMDFVTKYGSISSVDKDNLDYERKLADFNRRLADLENRYYSKFTAMEQALQKLNSQSTSLMQQLGGSM